LWLGVVSFVRSIFLEDGMRIGKILVALLLVVSITGCSCRAKRVGGGDNLPDVTAGSELKDVHFSFDSYALDASSKSLLQQNANWLNAHPEVKVQVEGHCDERGTNEYNMVLGANRARAAADYVRSLGVDAARISTVSYGEELPLDPRHTEAAWAKNRRAHFSVQR
jgi:peptidoglycan-associated lipoprotein